MTSSGEEEKLGPKLKLTEDSSGENSRKIPKAVFIDSVTEFVAKNGRERVQKELSELYSQYKYMEASMVRQKLGLKSKLPDIEKTLEAVKMLDERASGSTPEFETQYLLSDNIWASVDVPNDTGNVMLWLGANTLVEFPIADAQKLLQKNLDNGNSTLGALETDLDFIKTQLTTMEVNLARVHNEVTRLRRLDAKA